MLLTTSMSATPVSEDASLLAFQQYDRLVKSTPHLSAQKEEKLLTRVRRGLHEQRQVQPNQWVLSLAAAAREELIECSQWLVLPMVYKFARRASSFEVMDLVQEANIALLSALDQCERYAAIPFQKLAVTFMTNALRKALRQRDLPVRLPGNIREALGKLQHAETVIQQRVQRQPTETELAHEMQVSEHKIRELVGWREQSIVISVQALMEACDVEEEDYFSFVALYEPASAAHVQQQEDLMAQVQQVFEQVLTPRQRVVLALRFGLRSKEQGLPASEVAQRLGVSVVSIGIVERRAVERLRAALEPESQVSLAPTPEAFYTVAQVAMRAGVRGRSVYMWAERGKLTKCLPPVIQRSTAGGAVPDYVFDQQEVERFLAQRNTCKRHTEQVA